MATEYRNNAKLNVVTRRWRREHFPTPPSPSLPPLCSPLLRCRSFPALLQLALVSLSSRIKPLLEMCLEALEHLFFYVFDVGEPVPTSDIAVFTGTLKFQNFGRSVWLDHIDQDHVVALFSPWFFPVTSFRRLIS